MSSEICMATDEAHDIFYSCFTCARLSMRGTASSAMAVTPLSAHALRMALCSRGARSDTIAYY